MFEILNISWISRLNLMSASRTYRKKNHQVNEEDLKTKVILPPFCRLEFFLAKKSLRKLFQYVFKIQSEKMSKRNQLLMTFPCVFWFLTKNTRKSHQKLMSFWCLFDWILKMRRQKISFFLDPSLEVFGMMLWGILENTAGNNHNLPKNVLQMYSDIWLPDFDSEKWLSSLLSIRLNWNWRQESGESESEI